MPQRNRQRAWAKPRETTQGDEFRSFSDLVVKGIGEDGSRLIFGVVMRPNVLDADDDYAEADLVRKAAHDFLASLNVGTEIGVQHNDFQPALDLVESSIETEDGTRHNLEVRKGDWTAMVRVNDDDVWQAAQEGKLTGFSIGGLATGTYVDSGPGEAPIAKAAGGKVKGKIRKFISLSLREFSLVDKPANEVAFVIAKAARGDGSIDIEKARRFTPLRRRLLDETIARLSEAKTTLTTLRDDLDQETDNSMKTDETTIAKAEHDAAIAKLQAEHQAAIDEIKKTAEAEVLKAKEQAEQEIAKAREASTEEIAKAADAKLADQANFTAEIAKARAEIAADFEAKLTKSQAIWDEGLKSVAEVKKALDSLVAEVELIGKARQPSAAADGATVVLKNAGTGLFDSLPL